MIGFYITNKGRELLTNSTVTTDKVIISKACFGSGGNLISQPDKGITQLKNQIYEKPFDPDTDSYKVSGSDLSQLEIKTIVPSEVTGTINEVGYKDESDNLIIYGVVQDFEKEDGIEVEYDNWIKLEAGDSEKIEINIATPDMEAINDLTRRVETLEGLLDGLADTLEALI